MPGTTSSTTNIYAVIIGVPILAALAILFLHVRRFRQVPASPPLVLREDNIVPNPHSSEGGGFDPLPDDYPEY
ncbi:hypothetical protein G6514_005231 [Epicoccum nigrum]|nr:hypothetical protein G6514_005231 [Epicoccum nigrum]